MSSPGRFRVIRLTWSNRNKKVSPNSDVLPPHPVSENNCYIHTKQTRTHLSEAADIFLVLENPPEKMSISQVAEFLTPVSQRTSLTSLTTTSKNLQTQKRNLKRTQCQCNSGCLHCSFSRSQSTWPRDRALMGHAPSQISMVTNFWGRNPQAP